MGYAAYLLFHNVSFWQALIAGVIGIVASFLLVGFTSLAGKRGSAPTMVLSRASFGVNGNRLPTLVSYLLLVGWETVTMVLAIFAVDTIFVRLRLERRHADQGDRLRRGGLGDRRRRLSRVRRHHETPEIHHLRDDRADHRLRRL